MTTRKNLLALSFWAGVSLAMLLPTSFAVAQTTVFKCQEGGQTVYKDNPCGGGQGTVAEDVARKELDFKKRKQAEVESNRILASAPKAEILTRAEAVDRMTTYAVILGREVACGIPNTQDAFTRVGKWMDAQNLTKQYLATFTIGVKHSAEQQRDGNTPDSCSKVKSMSASFPWP
jgi:hypothetical protein